MTGWDASFLQQAIDTCTNLSGLVSDCPLFTLQDGTVRQSCRINVPLALQNEDVVGPMPFLPGTPDQDTHDAPDTSTLSVYNTLPSVLLPQAQLSNYCPAKIAIAPIPSSTKSVLVRPAEYAANSVLMAESCTSVTTLDVLAPGNTAAALKTRTDWKTGADATVTKVVVVEVEDACTALSA